MKIQLSFTRQRALEGVFSTKVKYVTDIIDIIDLKDCLHTYAEDINEEEIELIKRTIAMHKDSEWIKIKFISNHSGAKYKFKIHVEYFETYK